MGRLQDKVALITGSSSGIGRGVAVAFAREGARVILNYPDESEAQNAASARAELEAIGVETLAVQADVAVEHNARALVETAQRNFGRIDILVNNASAARGPDRVAAVELPYEIWKKVLVTNLDGTFLLSCAAARRMIAQGQGGSIVNISSIASKLAQARAAAYSASKAAVNALSRSMALDLAPNGIRVNAVCPGIIDTFRMDDLGRGESWEKFVKTMIPLGYAGDGSECAEMVLFLVTDRGKWITGQAINVDGGTVWGN